MYIKSQIIILLLVFIAGLKTKQTTTSSGDQFNGIKSAVMKLFGTYAKFVKVDANTPKYPQEWFELQRANSMTATDLDRVAYNICNYYIFTLQEQCSYNKNTMRVLLNAINNYYATMANFTSGGKFLLKDQLDGIKASLEAWLA